MDLTDQPQLKITCEGCIFGGMKMRPHNHPIRPGNKYLDLIHFDLVGKIQWTGSQGEQYFAHILDDFTKMGDVECLKRKSQAFEYFLSYKKRVERDGFKIRWIKLDVGELATKRLFQEYCYKEGIIVEESVPYNKQQNGAAEQHGQSIWNKTAKTLHDAGIPDEWWTEVVRASVYLLNRCPHSALPNQMTPWERHTGVMPDVGHI